MNKCCDNNDNNGTSYVSYVKRVSLLSELLNENWELADAKSGSPLAQNAWKKNCRYVTRVYNVHKTNRIEKYPVASRFPTLLATLHYGIEKLITCSTIGHVNGDLQQKNSFGCQVPPLSQPLQSFKRNEFIYRQFSERKSIVIMFEASLNTVDDFLFYVAHLDEFGKKGHIFHFE